MDSEEFESVLGAAAAGAPWAWNHLYYLLSPKVLGFLRSRGAAEPEDLLGEVWLQVARGLSTFTGDYEGFRSWVFMIAHNRVIDERRKRGRRPRIQDNARTELIESRMVEGDDEMPTTELEQLMTVLDDLPELQQSVLLLRVIADLSVQQTADVLGITQSTVKTAQYRAVQKLRKKFTVGATDHDQRAVTELI